MCGIAGIHFKRARHGIEHDRIEKAVDLLLLGIESRGRDSTGLVAFTNNGKKMVFEKIPMRASLFIQGRQDIPRGARTILLHSRFATKGLPSNPLNNHPVQYQTVFLTHNGHIDNDDELFAKHEIERYGEVDTEIIAALIFKYGFEKINIALAQLDGGYAIAAVDPSNNPNEVILAKGPSSPLCVLETDHAWIWASEKSPIEKAYEAIYDERPKWSEILEGKSGQMLWIKSNKAEPLMFATLDAIRAEQKRREAPPPPSYTRKSAESTKKKKSDTSNSLIHCKGCGHRWSCHPRPETTAEAARCIGSERCHCRKFVSRKETKAPESGESCSVVNDGEVDPKEPVAYVGIIRDGAKVRYGVNGHGDLLNLETLETEPWPEESDDYASAEGCVCNHSEFHHVGLVGKCGYKGGCTCQVFRQVGMSVEQIREDTGLIEDQCDGCKVWIPENFLVSHAGATLCRVCLTAVQKDEKEAELTKLKGEAQKLLTAGASSDGPVTQDVDRQEWLQIADEEEKVHRWCLEKVAEATGYASHFVDWLLFRAEHALVTEDDFLQDALRECDETYGEFEANYYREHAGVS